jgi:hypothetical protein
VSRKADRASHSRVFERLARGPGNALERSVACGRRPVNTLVGVTAPGLQQLAVQLVPGYSMRALNLIKKAGWAVPLIARSIRPSGSIRIARTLGSKLPLGV